MPSLSSTLTERMNYLTARQGVISGNIANANTPGYLSQDISFKSALGNTMQPTVTNAMHLGGQGGSGEGKVTASAKYIQHNGNAVRLDEEMLKMQETQLSYRTMTEIYSKQVQMQKLALGVR